MTTTLDYILREFNMSAKQLADEIGISKVQVGYWVNSSREIPEKHLSKLSHIFGLPKSFFTKKKLNRVEELDVQIAFYEKLNLETAEKIEEVTPEGESYSFIHYDYIPEIQYLKELRSREQILLKIESTWNHHNHYAINENEFAGFNKTHKMVEMFDDIANMLLKSEKKGNALKTFVYLLSEKWGFGKHPFEDFEGTKGMDLFKDLSEVLQKHNLIKSKKGE